MEKQKNDQKDDEQTTALTQYTVQVRREAELEAGEELVEVWVELGQYEVPSGSRRKAIEQAMADHGLEEGSFHTIPESSAGVETCRVKKSFSWD